MGNPSRFPRFRIDFQHSNHCRPGVTCNNSNKNNDVLNAGDSIVLDNAVPGSHGAGNSFLYDGRDRIVALYPVAVTRGAYPDNPGSLMAGAVEVFDTSFWGTEYVTPLARGTSSFTSAFQYVGLYFMAGEDDTTVTKPDGSTFKLDMGESKFIEVYNRGQKYTADKKVQVTMVTGDEGSTYELRWFSLRPFEQWSTSYLSAVGDSRADTRIAIYNPNNEPLTVSYTRNSGTLSITVDPNDVEWTGVVETDSACKLEAAKPFVAYSISDTVSSGQLFDWGCPVMPMEQLTSIAFIGWGYGCTDNQCDHDGVTHARSVVWVAPTEDATVYVDYDNDGTADDNWNVDYLDSKKISNPNGNKDMSGAVIWATERNAPANGAQVAMAAAWGQDGSKSFSNDYDALDLGTVVVRCISAFRIFT